VTMGVFQQGGDVAPAHLVLPGQIEKDPDPT
jgi:hypothetical protein